MSSLKYDEKRKLERLFRMDGGYVLGFTNREFQEFVYDVTGQNIYSDEYEYRSGSKANRLRGFWSSESDQTVAILIGELTNLAESKPDVDGNLVDECRRVEERLRGSAPVPDLDALEPNAKGRDYEALARSVRKSIEENEPEVALDRLHTFVVRYVRVLAEPRGIEVDESKPLHSVFGELIKSLKNREEIESEMAERILKMTISTLESFNHVRNQRSLAHDNELLEYHEALLIFRHVSSTVRFLQIVADEDGMAFQEEKSIEDEFPF